MSRLPAVFILTMLAACATERDGGAYEVADSAGVRIARNGDVGLLSPAALDSPTLALRIGAVEGDSALQFFRLGAMAVDADGLIYAADMGHVDVRVFDAQGRFVRRIGRRGSGPGEFEGLNAIHVFGDTVATVDYRLSRLTLFDRRGTVLGTQGLRDSENRGMNLIARSDGGWIATPPARSRFNLQHAVASRDTVRLVWVSSIPGALEARGTSAADSVGAGALARWREVLTFAEGRYYGNQTPIFLSGTQPLFEPDPGFAVDGRGNVYYTDASSYVIDVYDTHGRHTRRLTRAHSPVPVRRELVERWAARVRAHWDTATLGGEAAASKSNDEVRASLPHVETLPPIGRMLASRDGSLWVERIDLEPDPIAREWSRGPNPPRPSRWDLFDPDGRFLGTVTLPPGFTPRLAGDRWMLGVLRDELDVQYIARYDLVEPR